MTLNGHMQGGVAVPDAHVAIPDGTPVRIEISPESGDFWRNKSLEELAKEQGVGPITDLSELAGDWPPEDSIEDFMQFLREIRQ